MSSLESLIRLHRWRLDEQQRNVAALEDLRAQLQAEFDRLDAEQAAEQEVAGKSPEASYGYDSYVVSLLDRRRRLGQSLADAERQIAKAREALAEIFQEVKRYEIAAARRLLNERILLEHQEQRDMDEIAIDVHRRAAKNEA